MSNAIELDEYVTHLKARGLRPASISSYVGWVRRLHKWLRMPLETATTADLERWLAAHDWKPNTHSKAVQSVQYYNRWLLDTGRIAVDPSVSLRAARVPTAVPNPCPEELYESALEAASGSTYWRLRLGGDTGLRRAELAAVHSDDVSDLVTGPALRVTDGKGGNQRWVPLPADLAAWLRLQRGWVFPARDGGHISAQGVGLWFTRHLGMNTHSLRHRYATRAYHGSRDLQAVRQLLGHSSIATTQVYLSVADSDLQQAASGVWGNCLEVPAKSEHDGDSPDAVIVPLRHR